LRTLLLLVVYLIMLGLVAAPFHLVKAQPSQPGLVCLADVTMPPAPPCSPGVAPIFDGPFTTPNQQIRLGVFISDSDGFLAFDITLKTNSSVLKPAGIDLAETILPGQVLLVSECLGGVNITNTNCNPAVDTSDTLQLAAAVFPPGTSTPSTGLLFTAIYNITGTTSKPTSVGFQTGCPTTSVAGSSGLCVTLVNGSPTPDPETVQAASFNNTIPIPYLTVSSNSSLIGPMTVGSTQGLVLNLTGRMGWNSQFCACTASLQAFTDPSVHVLFNITMASVPNSNFAYIALNATGSSAGNYTVKVLTYYTSFDMENLGPDTLVAQLTVQIDITDFAISATSPLVTGYEGSSQVSLVGENGFSGPVQLSVAPSVGSCSLSPYTLSVPGTASSALSCTWPEAGNYGIDLTAASGVDSHTIRVSFVVQDFAISLDSSSVSLVAGSSKSLSLTVTGLNGFNQQVNLEVSAPTGLKVTAQDTLSAPGTATLTITGESVGTYSVNVTVSYSGLSHTERLMVTVTAAPGVPSLPFGLPPSLFYSIVAALGIVATTVVALWLRVRRRPATVSNPGKDSSPRKSP